MAGDVYYSEQALFKAISQGDEQAFHQLFLCYNGKLASLAGLLAKSRELADDIVQDIFASIWKSRASLGDVRDPAGYLYRVAYNKISACLKDEKRKQQIMDAYSRGLSATAGQSAETEFLLKEARDMLALAVERLPQQKRLVYVLAKIEGRSYGEIAEELGISVNTVRNQLVAANKQLKDFLIDAGMALALPLLEKFF